MRTGKGALFTCVGLILCLVFTGHSMAVTDASCVIICPPSLFDAADALKVFHNGTEEISSEVVTTQQIIDAGYAEAEDPPFEGYTNKRLRGWRDIKNYDYTLAKQIISYLRDGSAHPNLLYVTILGDGLLVPPSYYFHYDSGHGIYANWVPMDFFYTSPFYTSPDYDFAPDFIVGRLSVSDAAEANHVVNKIIDWYSAVQWDWFKKVCFATGGESPFGDEESDPFHGERNVIELINPGLFSGMDITKLFETEGTFTKEFVEPTIKDEDAGIVFLVNHGYGDAFAFLDNTYLYASELMDYPPHANTPIVCSVSCNNGAFDLDLYSRNYPHSFGEAILKSQAGGIAYIGGVRYNEGNSTFHYDEQGNMVVEDYNYMWGIWRYLFESYHESSQAEVSLTLGKICFDALDSFRLNKNMGDIVNIKTLFSQILLGDPALIIPKQQVAPAEYPKPTFTLNPASSQHDSEGIPIYDAPPTVTANTDAPTLIWKLSNMDTRGVLDISAEPTADKGYTPSAADPARYLVRAAIPAPEGIFSTDYCKEGWLAYRIAQQGGGSMRVSGIAVSLKTKGVNVNAVATVTIIDASDQPVSGATVSGHWSDAATDTDSGVTDSSGEIALQSDAVKNPAPGTTFTFTIDDVTKDGWTYDKNAGPTSGSVSYPQTAPMLARIPQTSLLNAYPNPGNPDIWIPFALSDAERVVIKIHDINGRLVRTLELGEKAPGAYLGKDKAAYWDGKNEAGEQVASGLYFYTIHAGDFVATKKMIVAR